MLMMTEAAFAELTDTMIAMNNAYVNVLKNMTIDSYVSQAEAMAMTGKNARQLRYLADKGQIAYQMTGERGRVYCYQDLKKYMKEEEFKKVTG